MSVTKHKASPHSGADLPGQQSVQDLKGCFTHAAIAAAPQWRATRTLLLPQIPSNQPEQA